MLIIYNHAENFRCGGTVLAPNQFGSEGFSTFSNGQTPRRCEYQIGDVHTFRNLQFRVIYTDLPGDCSQGKIEVYKDLSTAESNKIATICSAEDAEKVVNVPSFLMTVVYDVKVPGLRGFRAVVRDQCNTGFKPSRSGQSCEGV